MKYVEGNDYDKEGVIIVSAVPTMIWNWQTISHGSVMEEIAYKICEMK